MALTAKAEYACAAMIELAIRYADPKPAKLGDIAAKHEIPQRFLVQILLQLKAAGLVSTTRGAAGGYNLVRPPERITLADILNAVEPVENSTRSLVKSPALSDVWKTIEKLRFQVLKETTLANLLPKNTVSNYSI